jgi:hypothetical protein
LSKIIASSEPLATAIVAGQDDYVGKMVVAFNWYNTEKDRKDARKYLEDYCKKFASGKSLSGVPEGEIVLTMGWVARLAVKGASLSDDHLDKLNKYLTRLQPVQKVVVPSAAPKVSIQEATQNRIRSYLGELEGVIDDLAKNPKADFSLLDDLKKNQLPQTVGPDISVWTKAKLAELIAAYEGKDKDLAEGYSNFRKKDLLAFIKKLASFIEDADKYSAFKKANRKPREKKVKPAGMQVKSLKYKVKDDELKISSVSPSEVVGAQQVWVYNTKIRKLAVYRTDSAMGIQVKGTTLQNYDPEQSMQKTLRKPAEQLKDLLAAGKVQLRKFMDNIKAVPISPNGRMNADTLIVRCIK